MAKRTVVKVDFEKVAHLIEKTEWSKAAFARLVGKHSRWLSDVSKGNNLPSPEEASRMCILLKTTPDDILLHEGNTPEETAKCLEDIETVRKLVEAEGIKETPDPKIEGVDDKIAQFIRSASAEELTEISRYIEYLESKRDKT